MQPPRLAANARGKLPYRLCSNNSRVRTKLISHQAVPPSPFKRTLSRLGRPRAITERSTQVPRNLTPARWPVSVEKSGRRSTVTHIAMSHDSIIARRARQRTHRRRFVRPPTFLKPRWSQIVGAASDLRNTPSEISGNPFDAGASAVVRGCCSVAPGVPKASF